MWGIIATIGLKLLGWFLDAKEADAEARKSYLAFIDVMTRKGLVSKSLHNSYEEQRKKNLEELKKQ